MRWSAKKARKDPASDRPAPDTDCRTDPPALLHPRSRPRAAARYGNHDNRRSDMTIKRRDFLKKATAVGMTAPAVAMLLSTQVKATPVTGYDVTLEPL